MTEPTFAPHYGVILRDGNLVRISQAGGIALQRRLADGPLVGWFHTADPTGDEPVILWAPDIRGLFGITEAVIRFEAIVSRLSNKIEDGEDYGG